MRWALVLLPCGSLLLLALWLWRRHAAARLAADRQIDAQIEANRFRYRPGMDEHDDELRQRTVLKRSVSVEIRKHAAAVDTMSTAPKKVDRVARFQKRNVH